MGFCLAAKAICVSTFKFRNRVYQSFPNLSSQLQSLDCLLIFNDAPRVVQPPTTGFAGCATKRRPVPGNSQVLLGKDLGSSLSISPNCQWDLSGDLSDFQFPLCKAEMVTYSLPTLIILYVDPTKTCMWSNTAGREELYNSRWKILLYNLQAHRDTTINFLMELKWLQ